MAAEPPTRVQQDKPLMNVPARYRPCIWTVFACCVAAFGLLNWWVTLHPSIWGGHEFEGMVQTMICGLLSLACVPIVLIFVILGMVRKDPLSFVVFAAVTLLAVWFYTFHEPNVHL